MARVRRPSNIKPTSRLSLGTIIFGIAVLVISGYLLNKEFGWWTDESKTTATNSGLSSADYAPALGPTDAPVVLAKWTDFQ